MGKDELREIKLDEKQPPAKVLPGDEIAPRWMSKAVYFFRLGLAIFLTITWLLGLSGCSSAGMSWHKATQDFSAEQVGAMLVENSSLEIATDEQIERVQSVRFQNVVVIDFNQPELCSNWGCLYSLYEKTDAKSPQSLFKVYLKPTLPSSDSLITDAGQSLNNYPCLHLYQTQSNAVVAQFTICHTGHQYQITNHVDRS